VIQIVKLRQIVGRFARLPKMDSAGAGIIDAERALAAYCSKADRANAARRKKKDTPRSSGARRAASAEPAAEATQR
jgi:hypothetical protein